MGWIITTILLTLIGGSLFFLGTRMVRTGKARLEASEGYIPDSEGMIFWGRVSWIGGVVGAGIIFALMTLLLMVRAVGAGNVGVVYEFGSIVGQVEEGVHIVAPWQSVTTANVQTQKAQFEKIAAVSQETQDVTVDITVNYRVSPGAIQTLYREVGTDYFNRLVPSRVNQFVKDTTVQYTTVDIAPNREKIKRQVAEKLSTSLAAYSVEIVDVNIDNLAFSEQFTNAVEAKQVATQEAERERQRVRQREFEGQQQVATARASAQANRLLSASLTDEILRQRALDVQQAAIEKLNPKVSVVMLPSTGAGSLIDVSSLIPKAQP